MHDLSRLVISELREPNDNIVYKIDLEFREKMLQRH